MSTQKPDEWALLLISRFEDRLPYRSLKSSSTHSRIDEEINKRLNNCLIQISRYRFSLVISNFTKILQNVNEFVPFISGQRVFQSSEQDRHCYESIIIILETLEKCLANQSKDSVRFDEAMNVKFLLKEICQFIDIPTDTPQNTHIKNLASKVLFALSINYFNAVFNRISSKLQELAKCGDENTDYSDIELIQHINVDVSKLTKLLSEGVQKFKQLKKSAYIVLMISLEKAIWNWMDTHSQEFAELQTKPNEDLGRVCEELFDILDTFADNKKGRAATVWPLQIMLLILSPKVLSEIVLADSNGPPCSLKHTKKKQFIETIKRSLGIHGSSNKQLIEAAVITCTKLCKASTYVLNLDMTNIIFVLVHLIINDVLTLLFNSQKVFSRSQSVAQDIDLMIDCFVSFFRIQPENNEVLKVCLNLNHPVIFQFVLVNSMYKIVTQPRLPWWPQIDLLYSYSAEFRNMFIDVLNKVIPDDDVQTSHTPLRMIQSLTLKGNRERGEETASHRNLLLWMVKLIHADPMLLLNNQSRDGEEVENSTLELINGLVSLVHQPMVDIAYEAMEALLVLHRPDRILAWNPVAPIQTFWNVSSQVMYSISQKLIHHQIVNYTYVLKWLKEMLICRNTFLAQNKDYANQGSQNFICKEAYIKLEVVFLMYLWSVNMEAVTISMSCFALLCEEAEIRCSTVEVAVTCLLPNYHLYLELAQASTVSITASGESKISYHDDNSGGQKEDLQKRIMAFLRKIEHGVNGIRPAWEETYRNWEMSLRQLGIVLKSRLDDGQLEFHRTGKRRTSHQNSEHELEEQINEWANMTGFLCALGRVYLQKCSSTELRESSKQQEATSSLMGVYEEVQYCTQFVYSLMRLLICNNDKCGNHIQEHITKLVGREMSPALYPILFDQINGMVEKFFDQQGQVIVTDMNTQFVDHIIFIMKSILDSKTDEPSEYLGMTSIDGMMLPIVRYVRHLDMSLSSVNIKTKLCEMVESMMKRRDDLAFRQEMKFRNKLVEYLTDWLMGTTLRSSTGELTVCYAHTGALDQACMQAVSALLLGLPLQSEESDRGSDLMEAKSQLFLKYFTLFMNLLNYCNTAAAKLAAVHETLHESQKPGGVPTTKLSILRDASIQAMSNLLSANIDSGLMHSLRLGYHADLRTRAAFMEVLTKILQQGTEFDTLAETVLADRFEQLVQLVTMMSDKGELPIAMALANVVTTNQMDELAGVLVTLFDAKHLLTSLLWNMFYREVEVTDCMQTLFRGNSLGSKIMAFCFKIYGTSYLYTLLNPLISPLADEPVLNFEVDTSRLGGNVNTEQNRRNLITLTRKVFDAIISSVNVFPPQLRSMCHCLYQVLSKRFSKDPQQCIGAVGTILFLRFINPAIVSAHEMGIVDTPLPRQARRGLMLMSKILQNIANHVEFSKEQHMVPFNDFLRSQFEHGRKFFVQIASDCETAEQASHGSSMSFVSDANVLALHRLLWNHQERIGDYLSSSRDHKAVGRRPFDKMATLLAYLGPPEHKSLDSQSMFSTTYNQWSSIELVSSKFEDVMVNHNMHETEEFKNIKSSNIFYRAGTSKQGRPVFCYVARRFKSGDTSEDLLLYHVILTLKPLCKSEFDLFIDLSHANANNKFKIEFLQKWFYVLPQVAYENVHVAYIYNCNTWVRTFTKFYERILAPLKGNKKLVFIDGPAARLNEIINADELRLPGGTLSLDEDLKVFNGALKLSSKDTKVSIKVGPTVIQITSTEKCKVLAQPVLLNDVYYASEIIEVCLVDDNQFALTVSIESGPLIFIHNDCDSIVQAINHIKNRWILSQPASVSVHPKIGPKDVPGTLLNMALLNLGSSNPNLRTAAYNHLCALTQTFGLKIGGQLLETSGLCIPSNNTIFIKHISETLAANDPHLTLEFLEECIQGFRLSTIELKHLCLEYMTPWLNNLVRFYKANDEGGKRQKQVTSILDKLITLTIEEVAMYPSIQAKIWSTIGRLPELIDTVLDNFIQRSANFGLGSPTVEIMAGTAVALASGNVQLVAKKIIKRLIRVLNKTCTSQTQLLERHPTWDDIAILARYLLMLSFNNCLDVGTYLPYIFHIVTILVGCGNVSMRASTHGLVINVIHSLCTCSTPSFSEETHRILRMSLDEFSLPKFYLLFGISEVKSAAGTAFRSTEEQLSEKYLSISDKPRFSLTSLEIITDALLEIMETCMRDIPDCDWLKTWTSLARNFAFCYNPALQPRALIVFGCISKSITDQDVRQLLKTLKKALESCNDITFTEAIIMCLTRLQPLLRPESLIHRFLFWIATSILQLEEPTLYARGLALLEQNLHTLDSQGTFDNQTLENVMMSAREPLEWTYKNLDNAVGIYFKSDFHFALVGHLLKGFREPSTVTRTCRVLTMLLCIIAKPFGRDKFEVTPQSVPYLCALVSVSEEVRSRVHVRRAVTKISESGNRDDLDTLIPPHAAANNSVPSTSNPANRRQKSCDLLDQSALDQARQQKQSSSHQRSFSVPTAKEAKDTKAKTETETKAKSESGSTTAKTENGSTKAKTKNRSTKEKAETETKATSKSGSTTEKSETETKAKSESGSPKEKSENGSTKEKSETETKASSENGSTKEKSETETKAKSECGSPKAKSENGSPKAKSVNGTPKNKSARVTNENNVLLDPTVLTDFISQTLVLSILVILVKNSNDDDEQRILFEYLAEASVVFPKGFSVIHSLLDAKLTTVLTTCYDQRILNSVQTIVQNMIACEDTSQQQLHYLQIIGFGGLWRLAGPFTNSNYTTDKFVNWLEVMIAQYFPGDETEVQNNYGVPGERYRRLRSLHSSSSQLSSTSQKSEGAQQKITKEVVVQAEASPSTKKTDENAPSAGTSPPVQKTHSEDSKVNGSKDLSQAEKPNDTEKPGSSQS